MNELQSYRSELNAAHYAEAERLAIQAIKDGSCVKYCDVTDLSDRSLVVTQSSHFKSPTPSSPLCDLPLDASQ